ncbi:interleukin-18-binding protein [Rana temporaria]|uniref:interleukin-18-binding protein n=1 Tax=Rana temporaria TaxID=8407 RepID=UPI001AAD325F|nr:interleukin-18-binding protein [Rana temporaria]
MKPNGMTRLVKETFRFIMTQHKESERGGRYKSRETRRPTDTMTHTTHPGGRSLFTGLIGGLFITMTVAVIVPPKILHPTDGTILTTEGDGCRINCTARTMFPKFYIVYWLVNDTFIEDAFLDGRVKEEEEDSIINNGPSSYEVTKALVFTSTQPDDFTRTFTCIVQDPAGVDTKNITLAPKAEKTTTRKPKDGKRHNRPKRNKKGKKQEAGQ